MMQAIRSIALHSSQRSYHLRRDLNLTEISRCSIKSTKYRCNYVDSHASMTPVVRYNILDDNSVLLFRVISKLAYNIYVRVVFGIARSLVSKWIHKIELMPTFLFRATAAARENSMNSLDCLCRYQRMCQQPVPERCDMCWWCKPLHLCMCTWIHWNHMSDKYAQSVISLEVLETWRKNV